MPVRWTPTTEIRWFKPLKPGSEPLLQQMWIRDGHEPEWRNIPYTIEERPKEKDID